MVFKYLTLIAIAIFLSIVIIEDVKADSELKTDVKIITKLSDDGFMTPALSKNSTFVYCNFEFHLYSNMNNTIYSVIVDNITIANRTISNFKDIFYWKTSKDYIDLLEVYIAQDYYSYSNIFVFTYSITNRTVFEDKDLITFTKEEFESYIRELELKMGVASVMAWVFAGIVAMYYVRYYKEHKIEVVA